MNLVRRALPLTLLRIKCIPTGRALPSLPSRAILSSESPTPPPPSPKPLLPPGISVPRSRFLSLSLSLSCARSLKRTGSTATLSALEIGEGGPLAGTFPCLFSIPLTPTPSVPLAISNPCVCPSLPQPLSAPPSRLPFAVSAPWLADGAAGISELDAIAAEGGRRAFFDSVFVLGFAALAACALPVFKSYDTDH